jgi:hypothetical protein
LVVPVAAAAPEWERAAEQLQAQQAGVQTF